MVTGGAALAIIPSVLTLGFEAMPDIWLIPSAACVIDVRARGCDGAGYGRATLSRGAAQFGQ